MRKKTQRHEVTDSQAVSAWLADVSASVDQLPTTWSSEEPLALGRRAHWTLSAATPIARDVIDLRSDG